MNISINRLHRGSGISWRNKRVVTRHDRWADDGLRYDRLRNTVHRVLQRRNRVVELSDAAPARLGDGVDLGAEFGTNSFSRRSAISPFFFISASRTATRSRLLEASCESRRDVRHQPIFELLVFSSRRLI